MPFPAVSAGVYNKARGPKSQKIKFEIHAISALRLFC